MRFRAIPLLILVILIVSIGAAYGEDGLACEEWSWDNESVNVFTGSIDTSPWKDTELKFLLNAVFEPASEAAADTAPKFTHFNGKRLTMLQQSNTMAFTTGSDQDSIAFSGSLLMPEKDQFQKITITVTVSDPNGKELKKISLPVSRSGVASSQNSNVFFIPFEIRTVAIIVAAAAALVWSLAVVRNRVLNSRK